MGNSPLTVCISQAWEKQTVQVVLPDGQVMFMPHPLTVAMLMKQHPRHFVCQGSPSILEQRLPANRKLESGEIYYLLPFPPPVVTTCTTPTRGFYQNNSSINTQPQYPKVKQFAQKIPYKPSPPPAALIFDKSTLPSSFSDYAGLNLKPQRCLINLFVFRQSVASIMPEESFKPVSQSQGDYQYQYQYQYSSKPRISPAASPPPVLSNRNFSPKFDEGNSSPKQPVKGRGRKGQVAPWKPHLESISETKPVLHDFSSSLTATTTNKSDDYVNNFALSMTSGTNKNYVSSPYPSPPASPLNYLVPPLHSYSNSYGGQHQQQQFYQQKQRLTGVMNSPLHGRMLTGVMNSPLHGARENHRQKFIYSA